MENDDLDSDQLPRDPAPRSETQEAMGPPEICAPDDAAVSGATNRKARPGVLVVDDDETTCELIAIALRRHHFDVTWSTSPQKALEMLTEGEFDAVVTDLAMDPIGGLDLCERVTSACPDVPVIVVTGQGSMDAAIASIRVGASDFITKPVDTKLLALTVSRAVEHAFLRSEVKRLRCAVNQPISLHDIIGRSPAMRRVFDLVRRVADSDATVLITGGSGTGKELIARALHRESGRRDGPFLAINCAAVPPTLLESELFGHVRGAFTDAKTARTGLFVEASGGTLFMDEIAEMPLEMQPKLLRALQERKVRPVGGTNEVPFDVRIVAATNKDLEAEVLEKRFREDFYYRINVVRVDTPPLVERGGDVLLLAQFFLERFAARAGKPVGGLLAPAAERLMAYAWPGNVRELENCMESAVALTRFDRITVDDLPERIRDYRPERLVVHTEDVAELVTADELERRYVQHVLTLVGRNKSRAADILGFDRRTLYRKLARYDKAT